jgi:hypothetical protein
MISMDAGSHFIYQQGHCFSGTCQAGCRPGGDVLLQVWNPCRSQAVRWKGILERHRPAQIRSLIRLSDSCCDHQRPDTGLYRYARPSGKGGTDGMQKTVAYPRIYLTFGIKFRHFGEQENDGEASARLPLKGFPLCHQERRPPCLCWDCREVREKKEIRSIC